MEEENNVMKYENYRIKEYCGVFTIEMKIKIETSHWFRKNTIHHEWHPVNSLGCPVGFVGRIRFAYDFNRAVEFDDIESAISFLQRITEKPKHHYPPFNLSKPTIEDITK
jgi:hypothetical protein